jgi:NTP pyrophosphatase (non-canonical NTP hydrolase)
MNQTLTLERQNELAQEVGAWAAKNFDHFAPKLGIIEEAGEIAHCLLKRVQGIRGFDDPHHFETKLTDGLADIMIYVAHEAFLSDHRFDARVPVSEIIPNGLDGDIYLCGKIAEFAAMVAIDDSTFLDDLTGYVEALSDRHDIDLGEAIEATWEKVSKRDWRANKVDADKKSEAA